MLRKIMMACVAVTVIAAAAMPTGALARGGHHGGGGWHGGWHGGGWHRGWGGPRFYGGSIRRTPTMAPTDAIAQCACSRHTARAGAASGCADKPANAV